MAKINHHIIAVPLILLLIYLAVVYAPPLFIKENMETQQLIVNAQEQIIDNQEEAIYLEVSENRYLQEQIDYYKNEVEFLTNKLKTNPAEKSNEIKAVAPEDRLSESDIFVRKNKIEIISQDAKKWFIYDTNSMIPTIDSGATVLTEMPKNEEDVRLGDIIFFKPEGRELNIVHRVIEISSDERGTYYTTKGDNVKVVDPYKTRFSEISGVVIGIIY